MQPLGTLRPFEDSDMELVRSWRNAPGVRMNMYTQHEISRTEHEGWWDGLKRDPRRQYFMYSTQDTPAGVVAFTGIDMLNLNCSWAFYASPTAPSGTGARMEYLAIEHAFSTLGLHKLHCEVLAFNAPVIRLHNKFGFVEEGIFRHHHKGPDGFEDVHRLGVLQTEWVAKREAMLALVTGARRSA